MKVLVVNIVRKLSDIPCSNIFTDMSPRSRYMKESINKWDFNKIKNFCMAKQNVTKIKGEPTVQENIFASDTFDKELASKIYKEHIGLHITQKISPIKKWANNMNRHFSKENIQRAQRHRKGCSDGGKCPIVQVVGPRCPTKPLGSPSTAVSWSCGGSLSECPEWGFTASDNTPGSASRGICAKRGKSSNQSKQEPPPEKRKDAQIH